MAIVKYDPDSNKKPLWNEILSFSKNKYITALILVLIGLLGIIIPIIPGILLFVVAIALLRKGTMQKLRRRFRPGRKEKQ